MDSMDDILDDVGGEIESLQDRITKLETTNSQLKQVIVDNDLEDEIDIDCTSLEEQICVIGIQHIAEKVKLDDFDKNDVDSFDKLLKALRMIRGQKVPKEKKTKKITDAELFSIVNGDK
jgi:hypothetical protein